MKKEPRIINPDNMKQAVFVPTVNRAKTTELRASIDGNSKGISDKEKEALAIAMFGAPNSILDGIQDTMSTDNSTNELKENDKPYGVNVLNAVSGKQAANILLGLSSPVKISLYNSGFVIALNAIGETKRNAIQIMIGEITKRAAIKTGGFSFNADSMGIVDEVIYFIGSMIMMSNFKVPEDKTIWEYVSIFDLMPIVTGFINTLSPDGIEVLHACKNVVNGEICSNILRAELHYDELLRVNIDKLKTGQLSLPTVTTASRNAYRDDIGISNEYEGKYEKVGKVTVSYVLSDSSVANYIDVSNVLLGTLEKDCSDVVSSSTDDKIREHVSTMLSTQKLSKYAHFFQSVTIGDRTFKRTTDIIDTLASLSSIEDIRTHIENDIIKFINDRSVSVIGIPEYECEECKKRAAKEEEVVRGIIPLDMLNIFFDLYNLKKLVSK